MKKSTLMLLLLLITWAAMAAAWFWALVPFLTPMVYPFPSDWTEADLIRHLWPFHLVQPEWVSTPPDYMQWTMAETKARLAVVLLGWLVSITLLIRRYIMRRKKNRRMTTRRSLLRRFESLCHEKKFPLPRRGKIFVAPGPQENLKLRQERHLCASS